MQTVTLATLTGRKGARYGLDRDVLRWPYMLVCI